MTVDQDTVSADPAKDPAVVSARAKRLAELHAEFDEYPGPGLAVGAAVSISLIALVVALTVPLWLPVIERRFDDSRKSIGQRVEALEARPDFEARVAALEAKANTDLTNRLTALEGRVPGDIGDRLNRIDPLVGRVNDLSSREGLPALVADGATNAATAAMAPPANSVATPMLPAVTAMAMPGDATMRLATLEAAHAKLAAELVQARADVSGGIAADGAIEALRRRVNELDRGLTRLEDRIAGQDQRLDGHQATLGTLEAGLTRGRSEDTARAARILAIGQLRQSIEGGQAFGGALSEVRTMLRGEPGLGRPLDVLERNAEAGIQPVAELADRLRGLVPAALSAARQPGEGVVDQALGRLGEVVVIRRTGERAAADPESLEAKLDMALTLAEGGDIAAAREALAGIEEPAAAILAPWIADAGARVETLAALEALSAAMTAAVRDAAEPARRAPSRPARPAAPAVPDGIAPAPVPVPPPPAVNVLPAPDHGTASP